MSNAVTNTTAVPLGVNNVLMKGLLSAARKRCVYFNGTLAGQLQKNASTATVRWERIENLRQQQQPWVKLQACRQSLPGVLWFSPPSAS